VNTGTEVPGEAEAENAWTPCACLVSTAEGYERWASSYDQVPNPLLAREERYLLPLLKDVRVRSAVDLGCGTGRWLEKLAAMGCDLTVGVDCSGAMLRVAAGKKNVRGRLARAACENLPLFDAGFDLGICSFALGHICNLTPMVREMARVTRIGADVFVSDLHPEAYDRGWRVGFRDEQTVVEIQVRSRTAAEIVEEFCSNGFQCLTLKTLWLGEPERLLFARAGKTDLFAGACQVPAVLVCRFRRVEAGDQRREREGAAGNSGRRAGRPPDSRRDAGATVGYAVEVRR